MHTEHAYKDLGRVVITEVAGRWNYRAVYRGGYVVGDYKSLRAAKAALTQWHKNKTAAPDPTNGLVLRNTLD